MAEKPTYVIGRAIPSGAEVTPSRELASEAFKAWAIYSLPPFAHHYCHRFHYGHLASAYCAAHNSRQREVQKLKEALALAQDRCRAADKLLREAHDECPVPSLRERIRDWVCPLAPVTADDIAAMTGDLAPGSLGLDTDQRGAMNEDGCTCQRCGRAYKVDVIVPDQLWEQITNSSGSLLCGPCIAAAIEDIGEFDAFKLERIP